ncbi:DUF84 family protein [Virgibacillus siamensis]|uniref:DUF84 family protein n=1 Tax=Virgibacillus siamensis TaxID=480071 RepID=UPI0009861248|nr:DUF84 family protein [Virgibacillus siamensis]
MNILIGSENPAKIEPVRFVFHTDNVSSIEVPSKVSPQPSTDEETRRGAINRAFQCAQQQCDIGIGLEGGVMEMGGQLYVTNWGALSDGESMVTAGGARIQLPNEFSTELKRGLELGDIMDEYAKQKNVRKHKGAIGIFTNELVSRQEMFIHVVKLLKGQYEYKMVKK